MDDGVGQVRMGVPRVTVAVIETVSGLADALSEIESFAVGLPTSSGVKLTVIEQLAPDASVAPQSLVGANCLEPPLRVIPLMVTAELKLLVKVTVCAAGVAPTGQMEKFNADGEAISSEPTITFWPLDAVEPG